MASRRKPRPPNATAAEYILSPRLEKERTAVNALRKLGSDPSLNPLRRHALISPRSPRTFREFIAGEEDLTSSLTIKAGPPQHAESLKSIDLIHRSDSKYISTVSSAYKRRPTNDMSLKPKPAQDAESNASAPRRVLVPAVPTLITSTPVAMSEIIAPSVTTSDFTLAIEPVAEVTPLDNKPILLQTAAPSVETLTNDSINEAQGSSYAQRASDADLIFTADCVQESEATKRFGISNYSVNLGGGGSTSHTWQTATQPEVYIIHRPYVPEASLTRPHRQQTSQRQHLAVTEWAQQQTRLSVVHRRIFAQAKHDPGPPRPIDQVRVKSSRIKEAPPVISKISPKPAHLIGKWCAEVRPKQEIVEPMLKRADTERLTSYATLNEPPVRSHVEEISEQTPSDESSDESSEIPTDIFKPGPDIDTTSGSSMNLVSDGEQSKTTLSDDQEITVVQSRINFSADVGGNPVSGNMNSQLKRMGSLVRKQSSKERKPASKERLSAAVSPAGGGLSAIFANMNFGGPRSARRAPKDANAKESAVDPIYGPAPPADLTPVKLNWLPIRPAQISTTVWATVLQDDAKLPDLRDIHKCGEVINGKGLCGGVNQCYAGGTGEMMSARAVLSVGRKSQPDIGDSHWNLSYTPIKFDPDYSTLNKLFFTSAAAEQARASLTAPKKRAGILDQRRIQNLQIALKGLGIYDDKLFIVQTVLDMNTVEVHQLIELYRSEQQQEQEDDEGHADPARLPITNIPDIKTPRPGVNASFTTEVCNVLVRLVPTPDEIEMLRQADHNDLTLAEQHLLEWSSVNRFAEKLESLSSISIYVESYERVYALSDQMSKAVTKIISEFDSGRVFKAILALILKCGNYLNYKRRKFALGVQYSSLDLLRRTLSFTENTTLLRHISGVIDTSWPAIWALLEDCFGSGLTVVSLKELRGQLFILEQRVRKICLEVTRHGEEHNELFVSVLSIFLAVSAKQITKLNNLLDALQPMLLNLAQLFLPDAADPEQGVDVLKFLLKFSRDLATARDLQRECLIQERIKNLRKSRK